MPAEPSDSSEAVLGGGGESEEDGKDVRAVVVYLEVDLRRTVFVFDSVENGIKLLDLVFNGVFLGIKSFVGPVNSRVSLEI